MTIGGDPAQMRINAAKYGVSPQGIQQMNINLLNLEKEQYDRTKLQADAGEARNKLLTENYTAAAGRLAAFLKRPEDSSDEGQANWWDATLQGLYRDHLIDSNYLQSLQKQYPNGYPGQDAVQNLMATFNYASGISNGAKAMSEMSKASADQKAQTYSSLVTAAQSGPNAYHQALADNHVDPDSVPAQFDATGKPIPGAVDQLRQMGLTLEQQQTAKNAANTLTATTSYRNAMLANTASNEKVRNAILQQNADTNAARQSAKRCCPESGLAAWHRQGDDRRECRHGRPREEGHAGRLCVVSERHGPVERRSECSTAPGRSHQRLPEHVAEGLECGAYRSQHHEAPNRRQCTHLHLGTGWEDATEYAAKARSFGTPRCATRATRANAGNSPASPGHPAERGAPEPAGAESPTAGKVRGRNPAHAHAGSSGRPGATRHP